jgi:hypothetical protein
MPVTIDVVRHNEPAPTVSTYSDLQLAYDWFNQTLFENRLPPCLLTLHRKKNTYGYFWASRFARRNGENVLDEIALNPSLIRDRDDKATLSTLVHEMTHLEQQHFGKAPKNGYHDRAWGKLMERVGLIPSTTGKPGGKATGPKVSHYIEPGGRFEQECDALLATGFELGYMERKFSEAETTRAKAKTASKTKFCCPSCDAAAWGKPTLSLICGECEEEMEIAS